LGGVVALGSIGPSPVPRRRGVWLSWHDGTRSRNLARVLGVDFHAFTGFPTGPLRHVLGALWTCERLLRLRPTWIVLQNSFLLLLLVIVYKRLAGAVVIVDCHNKSLERRCRGPLCGLFMALKRWSFERVDLTMVSNPAMLDAARALSSAVMCLRDPLPREFSPDPRSESPRIASAPPYVLFPCSFEEDEPVDVIRRAAELLGDRRIAAVVTGDDHGAWGAPAERAPLVSRPGFVPFRRYRELVMNAAVVVVLTTDERCLMCGAYEALAAARPLVLSDTPVLRSCFADGAVYVPNDADRILEAVAGFVDGPGRPPVQARERFAAAFEQEFRQLLRQLAAFGLPVRAGEDLVRDPR